MIKLIRPPKPIELTEDVKAELTKKFKESKTVVWRKTYIVDALTKMSHGKCCYCETKLGIQGKALQVEHFHYKEAYPDEVVDWNNLLPSCSQCNSNKGIYDTIKNVPIINPASEDPKDYLYLKNYILKSKDNSLKSKGRITVTLLDLNNREKLINSRIQIAEAMRQKLDNIHEKTIQLKEKQIDLAYNRSRIVNGLYDILRMAQADAEYSAFMATIILTDEDYLEIKDILNILGLWNAELENLHNSAEQLKLDTSR